MNAKSRFLTSRLAAAAVVIAVLAVTATALASTTAASQVKTRKTSNLGTILVDSKGRTLYLFMKDKSGKSSCYGSCAANWPPYLTTANPKGGPGTKASMLGTTKRTDGKLQVTYNRHPLYRFGGDTKAGQTNGENVNAFGADWYVVSPKGARVEPKSSAGGGYGGGGYGGGPGYGGG